jgi:uncharacterized protein (TIGR03435 family)
VRFVAVIILSSTVTLLAQGGILEFEVASIKPTRGGIISGDGAARVGWDPTGMYRIDDGTPAVLVRSAYLDATSIEGLPGWATSEHFDVQAKAARPPTPAERPILLRQLLAQRFRLMAHVEERRGPVYGLRVARADGTLGPKLRRTPVDCATLDSLSPQQQAAIPLPSNGGPLCGMTVKGSEMVSGGMTLGILAKNIERKAGRVVLDQTGLTGYYEFTLETADDLSVFTALREQLGLTLEPSEAALPVLVIDQIERPSEN